MKALILILITTLLITACSSPLESQTDKQYEKFNYSTEVKIPKGHLAIVIDGNSPDPDDIGATPVMLKLLQRAGSCNRGLSKCY